MKVEPVAPPEPYLPKAEYEACRLAFESLPEYGSTLLFKKGGGVFNEDIPASEYVSPDVQRHWEIFRKLWKGARAELLAAKAIPPGYALVRVEPTEANPDAYYLQDSRDYVGNDMSWWKRGGNGYTTDLREAHMYTKEAAFKQHRMRDTDIPWLKSYIDANSRPAVDFQHVSQSAMLTAAAKGE